VGTNAPGEIAALGALVNPDAVVITSIGEEHLEGLGSVEGVAAEEAAILKSIRPKGFAAINSEHPAIRPHLPATGLHYTTFGRDTAADVRVTETRYASPWLHFMINERFAFRLRLPGVHNALNAAGAVTIARRLGLDYPEAAARLESFVLPPMRNEITEIGGITIINDAYNANPQSAAAAIQTLQEMPCRGRRIAVFGEMRELGAHGLELHRRVAGQLRASKVERVLLVGEGTRPMYDALSGDGLFGPAVERCADVPAALDRLAPDLRPGDVVLLKASRAVGLERLLEPLRTRLETGTGA
jgi:UDP-N-acetylmuramoyl-tripeptide--D-alanyl-D-alanine ligase